MKLRLSIALAILVFICTQAWAQKPADPTICDDCHGKKTPGIVSDWKLSKHSSLGVSCTTCHGDQHTSDSDVSKAKIPSPETCAQCHQAQVEQFKKGKHFMAWAAMKAMPTIHWQPMAMIEGERVVAAATRWDLRRWLKLSSFVRAARSSARPPATHVILGTPSRSTKPSNRKRAKRAAWDSTIPSGRCTPPSTASAMA
jgi:Cytochrome c7 and related cytochrome c